MIPAEHILPALPPCCASISNKVAVKKAPSFSVAGDVGEAGNLDGLLFTRAGDSGTIPDVTDKGAYNINEGIASKKIEATEFPQVGAVRTKTYLGEEQRSIEGKYDGAEGTFKCIGDTCQVTRSTDGSTIQFVTGGTWTFTPDTGQTNDVKDTKYLEFGWWVHKDKSKAPTFSDVFYEGSADSPALGTSDITALDGMTATYEGAAAGKFSIHDPVDSENNESGHFTADAMLKATFDETAATNAMTGTINNFKLNDGSANPGWSVNLEKANWDTDRFTTNGDTVWSIGDNNKDGNPTGSWEAQLFRTGTATTGIPDTVGGAFSSWIGATHEMVGAFGATHQPAE